MGAKKGVHTPPYSHQNSWDVWMFITIDPVCFDV